jgi:hypothetical protein
METKEELNKFKFILVVGGLAIVAIGYIAEWLATNGYFN